MTATNARRNLNFRSIADCRDDLQRVLTAETKGQLSTTGNWTASQILTHVAAWIEYGYEGYPMKKLPFFVQWILKRSLRKTLHSGMPTGIRIPGIKAGTTGMENIPVPEAGQRLFAALDRLEHDTNPPHDSPAFGKMSHEDRIKLNLRHAELHMSFLKLG